MADVVSDILIKITTYKGFDGRYSIEKFDMGTVKVSGKTPQTRLNKGMSWCADQCYKEKYKYVTYEVIGIRSSKISNGIYDLRGVYEPI